MHPSFVDCCRIKQRPYRPEFKKNLEMKLNKKHVMMELSKLVLMSNVFRLS